MNPTLIAGTVIVTVALISYSIAVISEQRKRKISGFVLLFLTAGICLDITATIFMIIGSHRIPITFHGVMGYSALGGMLIDTVLIWKSRLWLKKTETVSKNLHLYTRIAYLWWVIAYFAGGFIAMFHLY
jgi:hypothetical protein